jgi:hypothetical protein
VRLVRSSFGLELTRLVAWNVVYKQCPRPMESWSALYQPLSTEKYEIQLLRLLPSEEFAFLEIVSLDSIPEYIALSFEWGAYIPCNPLDQVVINLQTVNRVTGNPTTALLHIRCVSKNHTLFWIDALCINQNDQEERKQQVLLMK